MSSKGKTVLGLKLFYSLESPKRLFKILSCILRDFYLIIGRRIFQSTAGNSNVQPSLRDTTLEMMIL